MNTEQILVEPNRLRLFIEARNDEKGRIMYYVCFGSERVRFAQFTSVIDFVESNKDFGLF